VKTKKDKFLYCSSIVVLVSIFLVIAYLTTLLVYPYKLVTFNDDKFPILTPTVKAGEEVQFQVDFYRYTNLPTTVSRQLINNYVYYYPEVTASNPQGHLIKVGTVTIPANVEPGDYYIRTAYKYKVNFIREITIVKDTEYFEVIE
jgi:hypothetical protein